MLVDLDVGSITPPVGSPASDSGRLPAWDDLTETFSIMMVRILKLDNMPYKIKHFIFVGCNFG